MGIGVHAVYQVIRNGRRPVARVYPVLGNPPAGDPHLPAVGAITHPEIVSRKNAEMNLNGAAENTHRQPI
jgi:hypothetical protein